MVTLWERDQNQVSAWARVRVSARCGCAHLHLGILSTFSSTLPLSYVTSGNHSIHGLNSVIVLVRSKQHDAAYDVAAQSMKENSYRTETGFKSHCGADWTAMTSLQSDTTLSFDNSERPILSVHCSYAQLAMKKAFV